MLIAFLILCSISARYTFKFLGFDFVAIGPILGVVLSFYHIIKHPSNFKSAFNLKCLSRIQFTLAISSITLLASVLPEGINLNAASKAIIWELVKCLVYTTIYVKTVNQSTTRTEAVFEMVRWVLVYGCICTIADFAERSFGVTGIYGTLTWPFWLFDDNTKILDEFLFGQDEIVIARGCGISGDPNTSSLIAAFSLGFNLINKGSKSLCLRVILLLVPLCALAVTFSNTAIITLVYLIIATNLTEKSHSSKVINLVIALFLTGLVLSVSVILPSDYYELLISILDLKTDKDGTAAYHISIAGEGFKLFGENLFGSGSSSYPLRSDNKSSHNTYLQVLVEGGMISFALFMRWIIALLQGVFIISDQPLKKMCIIIIALPFIFGFGHDVANRFESICLVAFLSGFIDNKNL